MRQVLTIALTALLLTGCGTHANLTASYAPASALTAKKSNTAFLQVLRHERATWEAANQSARTFLTTEKPKLVMEGDLDQATEQVPTGVLLDTLAARPLANGGRELIGMATFQRHIPSTFFTLQAKRAFRLVVDAQGRASQFKITGESLPAPIVNPTFTAANADKQALMADLAAFLRKPEQKEFLNSRLWEAIAGLSQSNTFEEVTVRATTSDFGAFGRIFRFRGNLKHGGVTVIGERDMELEVVTDKEGQIVGAN
jgi:hypothetical protein